MADWSFRSFGNPGRPAVVFLHGFLGTSDDWEEVAEILANEYYCVLPNLPGYEDRSSSRALSSFHALIEELHAFLQIQALPNVTLVGYSLGGRLALALASEYPGSCSKLVLESASPGIADDETRALRAEADRKKAAQIEGGSMQDFLEEWYSLSVFSSLIEKPDLRAKLISKRLQNDPRSASWALSTFGPSAQKSYWNALSDVSCPTLLLTGSEDTKFCATATEMSKRLPQAECAIIEGAGHTVHLEQPGIVGERIRDFLERR